MPGRLPEGEPSVHKKGFASPLNQAETNPRRKRPMAKSTISQYKYSRFYSALGLSFSQNGSPEVKLECPFCGPESREGAMGLPPQE
jgi:hypothetical protein